METYFIFQVKIYAFINDSQLKNLAYVFHLHAMI